MIRTFFVEFLLPLLIFLMARTFLRGLFSSPRERSGSGPAPVAPQVQAGGELKRDPVCGTYVSTAVSLSKTVKGQVVYFCSTECRDKYQG